MKGKISFLIICAVLVGVTVPAFGAEFQFDRVLRDGMRSVEKVIRNTQRERTRRLQIERRLEERLAREQTRRLSNEKKLLRDYDRNRSRVIMQLPKSLPNGRVRYSSPTGEAFGEVSGGIGPSSGRSQRRRYPRVAKAPVVTSLVEDLEAVFAVLSRVGASQEEKRALENTILEIQDPKDPAYSRATHRRNLPFLESLLRKLEKAPYRLYKAMERAIRVVESIAGRSLASAPRLETFRRDNGGWRQVN